MSAWLRWFYDLLWSREVSIVLLGLDNAGKTTLARVLATNKVVQMVPTQKPTTEQFQSGSLTFTMHDLGGHKTARRLWSEYAVSVDAIVYLVDLADVDRIQEESKALGEVLESTEVDTPILVLGNKVDLPTALSMEDARQALGLVHTSGREKPPDGVRALELFPCSIVRRQGYGEGFIWLKKMLDA
jgi:GTP-binding protein SAR1